MKLDLNVPFHIISHCLALKKTRSSLPVDAAFLSSFFSFHIVWLKLYTFNLTHSLHIMPRSRTSINSCLLERRLTSRHSNTESVFFVGTSLESLLLLSPIWLSKCLTWFTDPVAPFFLSFNLSLLYYMQTTVEARITINTCTDPAHCGHEPWVSPLSALLDPCTFTGSDAGPHTYMYIMDPAILLIMQVI